MLSELHARRLLKLGADLAEIEELALRETENAGEQRRRELLDAGVQSDKGDTDLRWSKALRDEIMDVKVGISAKLLETEVSLRQLMELKAGDIIPVEMPESLLISVEDLPTFRGKLGRTSEKIALKITEKIRRPESVKNEMTLVTRRGMPIDGLAELEELEQSIGDEIDG